MRRLVVELSFDSLHLQARDVCPLRLSFKTPRQLRSGRSGEVERTKPRATHSVALPMAEATRLDITLQIPPVEIVDGAQHSGRGVRQRRRAGATQVLCQRAESDECRLPRGGRRRRLAALAACAATHGAIELSKQWTCWNLTMQVAPNMGRVELASESSN